MYHKKIPILMYHALEDEQHPSGQHSDSERVYVLQLQQFQQQMLYLKTQGFTPILASQIHQHDLPKRPIVITFDDGHVSNFHLALPILLSLNFVATFFITTGFINQSHYLNPKQIQYLANSGMEIGSHSVSHPFFNDLTAHQARYELSHSKKQLAYITGQKIETFSAPGGRLHTETYQLARQQGYKLTFCSKFGLYQNRRVHSNIPRIAMKFNTSLQDFKQIVSQNGILFAKKRIMDLGLYTTKKILGNTNYLKMREFVLHRQKVA